MVICILAATIRVQIAQQNLRINQVSTFPAKNASFPLFDPLSSAHEPVSHINQEPPPSQFSTLLPLPASFPLPSLLEKLQAVDQST